MIQRRMGPHGSILLLSFPLFSSSPFPFLSFLHLHLFLPLPRLPFIFCTVSFHLKRAETPIDYIRSDLLPWWLRRFNHATNIVVRSVNDALDFSHFFSIGTLYSQYEIGFVRRMRRDTDSRTISEDLTKKAVES